MSELQDAIQDFPIVQWCSSRMKVYDSDGKNFYCDCPICGGKRKLGVQRRNKLFHCWRCCEGGHGGGVWQGKANLVSMIRLLDQTSYHAAVKQIHDLAGFPEPTFERKTKVVPKLPEGALKLSEAHHTHESILWMNSRHMEHIIDKCYICVDGSYAGRIILPATFRGEFIGWEAKSYLNRTPKSLFPEWLDTSENIYTTGLWDDDLGYAVITESIIDAETIIWNGIGIYGSVLRDGQLLRLLDLNITTLIWMLDSDAYTKQISSIEKTRGFFANYAVDMPQGMDPNALGHSKCRKLIETCSKAEDELDFLKNLI